MTFSAGSEPWTAYAALSDVGRVRAANEDRWHADAERGLYLVSDGIGGHRAGHVAAQAVVDFLPDEVWRVCQVARDRASLIQGACDAVSALSQQIVAESGRDPRLAGMGATLIGVLLHPDRSLAFHVGDSRLYRLRDQEFWQITKDHSVVQLLEDAGVISANDRSGHPSRHQLTRYVGMSADPRPEAQVFDLAEGDRLLLCTDGLTGMLTNEQIALVLREAVDPQTACRRLIDAANAAGGSDNITVLVIDR